MNEIIEKLILFDCDLNIILCRQFCKFRSNPVAKNVKYSIAKLDCVESESLTPVKRIRKSQRFKLNYIQQSNSTDDERIIILIDLFTLNSSNKEFLDKINSFK